MTFHPTFRTNVYLEMQLSGKAPSNSFEFHLQLWKNQKKKQNKTKQNKTKNNTNKQKKNKIKKTKSNQIIKQTKKFNQPTKLKKNKKQKTKNKNKNLTSKQNTATSLTNEI